MALSTEETGRATKSGFAKEAADKQASKFDMVMYKQIIDWVNEDLGLTLVAESTESFKEQFGDGKLLINLMRSVDFERIPDSIYKKLKMTSDSPFVAFKMDRINAYNTAISQMYSLDPKTRDACTVETHALAEGSELVSPLNAIYMFGRTLGKIKAKAATGTAME